jgi:hypothetical protein
VAITIDGMVVEIKMKRTNEILAEVIGRAFVFVAIGLIAVKLENYLILDYLERALVVGVAIIFGAWVILPIYTYQERRGR